MLLKNHLDDIIEDEEGPTDWMSNPVFIPKAAPHEIRMKIDLRNANKDIRRNRHVISTVGEILYDHNGATIFSMVV